MDITVEGEGEGEKKKEKIIPKKPRKKREKKSKSPDPVNGPDNPNLVVTSLEDFIQSIAKFGGMGDFKKLSGNIFKETQESEYDRYVAESRKVDYEVVNNILSEFIDTYLLLGFKPNGELFAMRKTITDKDKDAILSIIGRYIHGGIDFGDAEG